jgi:hypothetical protein
MRILVQKPLRSQTLGRQQRRWENTMNMNLGEVYCENGSLM